MMTNIAPDKDTAFTVSKNRMECASVDLTFRAVNASSIRGSNPQLVRQGSSFSRFA
jgi:hypothetical protein